MKRLLQLFLSRQFITFLAVGGTAALMNFLAGAVIRLYWTSYGAYVGSVAAGFALGTVVSFVLNRRFTFRVGGEPVMPQVLRFGIITLGSVVVSLATASALFGMWGLLGQALVTRAQAESLGHVGAIGLSTDLQLPGDEVLRVPEERERLRRAGRSKLARNVRRSSIAIVLAMAAAGPLAAADDPDGSREPILLHYAATGDCPDSRSFEGSVLARTGHARFVSAGQTRTFDVTLQGGPQASGRVIVRRAGVIEGQREVEADTCVEAAEAMSLVVVLAINPQARLTPAPSASTGMTATPDAGSASPPPPPPPASAFPVPSVLAPAPTTDVASEPTTESTDTPDDQPARALPSHRLFAQAGLASASGVTPSTLFGVSPAFGWSSPSFGWLAVTARAAFVRAQGQASDASGGSATFIWTVGMVDGCLQSWPHGTLHLLGCLRLEAGTLEADGEGVPGAHSATRAWVSTGPAVGGMWDILDPLFIQLDLAAMVHVSDDRFFFPPNLTVDQVPLVGVEATAGVGMHFL